MSNGWNLKLTPKQKLFVDCTDKGVDEVFFGGAAGGGKSFIQCVDSVLYAMKYPGSKQVLLRESYPALERSIIRLFLEIVPKELYTYNSSKHTVAFTNGSILDFGYCDTEDSVYRYQSQEIDCLRYDEAGHFTPYMYDYLRSRVRGANNFPHVTKVTGNPGGPCHVFLRERFVEPSPPMEQFEVKLYEDDDEPETRLFIPCSVYENPFLMKSDPKYIKKLKGLPDQERRQLLEGDWYVFSGQFFPEFSRQIHVIDEIPLEDIVDDGKPTGKKRYPKDWRIYFSCDYGLDAFAGYFIAENDRGVAYFLGEVYQEGAIISDAAKMIKEKQKELKITKVDEYLAPSDLWNRRQETGKSAADIFAENGIRLHKATRDRIDGWLSVKEWLKTYKDEQDIETSKIKIHKSCVNLIKCVPLLQFDDHRPGDAATTPHNITHAPDALRYFCITRTRANREITKLSERELREEKEYDVYTSPDVYDVYKKEDEEDYGNTDINSGYNPMYM